MDAILQIGTHYTKMEDKTIQYGAIGILVMIVAALGGKIYLTQDQLNNAFICSANKNIVVATNFSSTLKTAYWMDENNITQSQVCRNGIWLGLKQYAKDNNLEINVLMQNINNQVIDIETNNVSNGLCQTSGNYTYCCENKQLEKGSCDFIVRR